MDPAERRYMEDDDTPRKKIIKGAALGLVFGTLCGTILAPDGAPLIRTFKMVGNCGLTGGVFGGIHFGFQQVLSKYLLNGDWHQDPVKFCLAPPCLAGVAIVEAFVAGVPFRGNRGKSIIPRALVAGSALAFTWAFADAGGQTTRIDNGKEDSAYTVE